MGLILLIVCIGIVWAGWEIEKIKQRMSDLEEKKD